MKTANQMAELLENSNVRAVPDNLFKYKGQFVARWFFYYTHGQNSQHYAEKIKEALPEAVIEDHSMEWNAWPKDSYFEVRFTV